MKYDEYMRSHETPKDLCEEIDRLRAEIEHLKACDKPDLPMTEEDKIQEALEGRR